MALFFFEWGPWWWWFGHNGRRRCCMYAYDVPLLISAFLLLVQVTTSYHVFATSDTLGSNSRNTYSRSSGVPFSLCNVCSRISASRCRCFPRSALASASVILRRYSIFSLCYFNYISDELWTDLHGFCHLVQVQQIHGKDMEVIHGDWIFLWPKLLSSLSELFVGSFCFCACLPMSFKYDCEFSFCCMANRAMPCAL